MKGLEIMFDFDISQIDRRYEFRVNHVSSMINPKDNTIMFITSKNLDEAGGINNCQNCLIFVPHDLEVKNEWQNKHCIKVVSDPRVEYTMLVNDILEKNETVEQSYEYINGSYISKDAQIGRNVVIEPLCKIDSPVVIGDNTVIKSGVKINGKVSIGQNCIIRENSVIGTEGFGFVKDREGNNIRFPFLGNVLIGDKVEVGALCNIANAIADATIIETNVKLDAFTFIAHDAHIGPNSLLVGAHIGGHASVGSKVFVGFNSVIKQRKKVESNSYIGMGAIVVKDVSAGTTVAGNPAKLNF